MARAQRLVGASTGAIVTCYSPVFAAAVADLEAEFKDTGEDNPVAQQVLIKTETYASAAANWTYASSQHSNALCPLVLMRIA